MAAIEYVFRGDDGCVGNFFSIITVNGHNLTFQRLFRICSTDFAEKIFLIIQWRPLIVSF